MSVMVSLELKIQPEKWEEAQATMREALKDTRAFEGCESLETYLDHDTHRMLLVETWAAPENQQAYLGWRMETGFMETAGALLAGEPVFTTWEITDI